MYTFYERFVDLCGQKKESPSAVAEKLGLSRSTQTGWKKGKTPYPATLARLAKYFDVSVDYLTGVSDIKKEPTQNMNRFNNIIPIETKKIPLLGDIACGEPIFASQEFGMYVECGTDIRVDFALRCKGDSMINARINDGDIVFIRQQSTVNQGEIAAVIVDDEATLKRVYIQDNVVTLVAENPAYAPITITREDNKDVRILGKAVMFQSTIR